MAFPETLNVELKTFKTSGVDAWSIVTLKEAKIVSDKEHVQHTMRDFSQGTWGSGDGTIEDMQAGWNWSKINDIPVVGGPVVEIDGKPVQVAPYFGQTKFRGDHWRAYDRALWEHIRHYGKYYFNAKLPE